MKENNHPVWGSNLGNQISARQVWDPGENGMGYRTEKVKGWFGREKLKQVYVGLNLIPAKDSDVTHRHFLHTCGLQKIIARFHRGTDMLFSVFLDGHVMSNCGRFQLTSRFAPEELVASGGKPIAHVWFDGVGTRHGPLKQYCVERIECVFANTEQVHEYMKRIYHDMPSYISRGNVKYTRTSTGQYKSVVDDDDVLDDFMVLYFLLSQDEQAAYAVQHPEVTEFVAGGGDFGGGGASSSFAPDVPIADVIATTRNDTDDTAPVRATEPEPAAHTATAETDDRPEAPADEPGSSDDSSSSGGDD